MDPNCTEKEAIEAWHGFFNHDYWEEKKRSLTDSYSASSLVEENKAFDDTEEFVEDKFGVDLSKGYYCRVSCKIKHPALPKVIKPLHEWLKKFLKLPHNLKVCCEMEETNCPEPYTIYWKVRNVGSEAVRLNNIRGEIENRGPYIEETTKFQGNHYIECYIVKENICVAKTKISVPIGGK